MCRYYGILSGGVQVVVIFAVTEFRVHTYRIFLYLCERSGESIWRLVNANGISQVSLGYGRRRRPCRNGSYYCVS
jgi:hypothetical protein